MLVGLFLLLLGLAHFSIVPGTTIDGSRYGWDGTMPGTLLLVLTWLVGCLLLAYTVLCLIRASLRPLGAPLGPRDWMRPAIKGAVASIVTFVLMWPGLQPTPWLFAPIPFASLLVLAAWIARLAYGRGPLVDINRWIGGKGRRHSLVARVGLRTGLAIATGLSVLVLAIGSWFLVPAWTPPIVDAHGNHVSGSIASLETVPLGGADQSILIRGWSTKNPVLLVLPGGPGGSYMGEGARLWGDLEKQFTVVEWDPRGVGKSYDALQPTAKITVQQIVRDTIQLSEILRSRFHQQRIYLMGHSGGSIYGVWAVKQRPDLFAAYIGGSQMVNNRLTDQHIYQNLLRHATKVHDTSLLRMLRDYGPPPYWAPKVMLTDLSNVTRIRDGLGFKYADMIGQGREVFEAKSQSSAAYEKAVASYTLPLTMAGMSPEYTLMDRINSIRGLNDVFTVLYPQLQAYDFRRDAPVLKVPVYFMLGQYDANGTYLSVDYFHKLKAPHKALYIFPKTSHGEIFQQPSRFTRLMTKVVLPETRARLGGAKA
jgi:pimeloyl-ACP methyl ester carboxylesterase